MQLVIDKKYLFIFELFLKQPISCRLTDFWSAIAANYQVLTGQNTDHRSISDLLTIMNNLSISNTA